ncbi:hypothetical protein NDU88_001277 [Pleurodeles waltl]|uniref:Uncharacterized protein n=1 Tax=Pleurodeles waltl TaxID=8319 RepID=A0AAV7Q5G7_PLEWA|nr:hypothetical protein NDU88_001277 [Pleurodeles waltl]
MASQRHTKKEGPLKDSFARTSSKKLDPTTNLVVEGGTVTGQGSSESDNSPITKAFLEQLFGVLRGDFATLKQEIATEVKDLRRDIGDLGHQMDLLERTHDTRE